jgi:hypothetical protein
MPAYTTNRRELVADDRIGLFDNGRPNDLHAEPTMAEAGKHIVCEKPLGRTAADALRGSTAAPGEPMWGKQYVEGGQKSAPRRPRGGDDRRSCPDDRTAPAPPGLIDALRSRERLLFENLLLRQQLQVALRNQGRPRLRSRDNL